jgi:hypothetical protein
MEIIGRRIEMNHQKSFAIGTLLLLGCFGCGRGEDSAASHQTSARTNPEPVVGANAQAPGGGQTDLRPRALILTPMRGASSVDVTPLILVQVSCEEATCATDVPGTLSKIASRIRLVDKSGSAISVSPQPAATTMQATSSGTPADKPAVPAVPVMDYKGGFLPTSNLAADAAYTLEVKSDGDVVVGFLDQSPRESAAALAASTDIPVSFAVPVFTGSAPKLAAITVPIATGKTIRTLQLRFSEPVYLADLAPSSFGIDLPGNVRLAGCVLSPTTSKCVDSATSDVAEGMDFAVTGASPSDADMGRATFLVGGIVRGSGRNVAAGAALRGTAVESTRVGAGVRVQLTAADWADCTGGGKCVRDVP